MKKQKTFNQVNKELLDILIIEYRDNNMSLRKIQDKYKVNRHVLSKILEKEGVKTTKGNHYRYHFHNFDYFEIINSHSKAYWLGFIMADGYIQRNQGVTYGEDRFGISLSNGDIDTLELFKKEIEATNPIKVYEEKVQQSWIDKGYKETQTICRILLSSQKTVDDLMDKGVIYNKSLTKKFPGESKVPREFVYSYLRGYMDGNGHIAILENKTQTNSLYLSFSSSKYFVEELAKFGDGRVARDKRNNGWGVFFNRENSQKLLDKIYEDSTKETRMERKYKRYIKHKK